MNFDQTIYDNADVTAATGISAATIQTWANRGILMLTKQQQNPGPGQKRLYSILDIARIAATQSLISYGMNASVAGRLAASLEHEPHDGEWREALQENTGRIYILVVDGGVSAIRSDALAADHVRNVLSEDCQGGFTGSATNLRSEVAMFNVGPAVSDALRFATAWHKAEFSVLDVPGAFATGLMNSFAKAFRSAGCPKDAEVFHGQDSEHHIYYFCPAASAIAPKELRKYTACPAPPSLAGCRKVMF